MAVAEGEVHLIVLHKRRGIYRRFASASNPSRINCVTCAAWILISASLNIVPVKVTDCIATEQFLLHNPAVGDRFLKLVIAIAKMKETGTPRSYTNSPFNQAEGNFVLTASVGQFQGKQTAF